ncbi:HD-like signal output (HDOD) domain, no enzymatic activity [Desulfuromusa kysingii]|uniref:histidine kinase n=1 Tax=Desulfuromusa kysingii TaxID=37625 RepID=A0A1H3WCZ4_9BACT|nr:HDOD domain-containing protein [Desulfuromusa kysingii]SDZ85006.1 HD-like signal output (HDOD) domain, no enzymatic activity [Desulfuromusa kysingii]
MQCLYLRDKSYAVENLPSEPSLLVELLELCHNDNANFEMFSTAIKKDISLTTKILQVANSPIYRQWNEITDIRRMLIVLGMTNVRNIITTCAIQQFFSNFTQDFNKHVQLIWLRALNCANLAERLAKLVGYDNPGEAFLSGLLHQVGMLLLILNREEDYVPLLERYYQETANFHNLEQEILGVEHCELGAALVQSWNLDSFLADAIQFQNAPADELYNSPTLLKILAVASPLSANNSARDNSLLREKAGLLFDLTEDSILDCLTMASQKSEKMITDLGFSHRLRITEDEMGAFSATENESNRKKLAEKIHDITLSNSIGKSEKAELLEFTKEVRIYFNAVFNLNQLFFFKLAEDQTTLCAVNDLKINQLSEIEFKVEDKNSLLVKSFTDKKALLSSSARCSIADQQVIRLLNAEACYFLPVHHNGIGIGVLALGTSAQEWLTLKSKSSLLKLISSEIAKNYFSLEQGKSQPIGMPLVDFKKVAHEISNPLTIINNYLYMLGKKIDTDHPAQEELTFISEEIERVGNILLRAKDPEAPARENDKTVNINKLLTELDTLFKNSLYKTNQIQSTLHLDQQVPVLCCPKDKLKQILINIIKNGVEAMQNGGTVTITGRDNVYQNGKQYVEITIKDNGPGIDAEILKNLFKPVTSTKEGHSGLGLTIVNTLVKELSGSIFCYSNQDQGTEFKVLIPRKLKESEIELK